MNAHQQKLIAAVRDHAAEYNTGWWDVLSTWRDQDVAIIIGTNKKTTEKDAIETVRGVIATHHVMHSRSTCDAI